MEYIDRDFVNCLLPKEHVCNEIGSALEARLQRSAPMAAYDAVDQLARRPVRYGWDTAGRSNRSRVPWTRAAAPRPPRGSTPAGPGNPTRGDAKLTVVPRCRWRNR